VPEGIAEAVVNRWPDRGAQWCAEVEDELVELCARYKAVPISVFRARYGLAVEVEAQGEILVMRSSPDPDGAVQAAVSEALASLGVAPAVREVIVTRSGTWTVLDRVVPGTSLYEAPASLGELALMLRPLCDQPAPLAGMPSLVDWLRARLMDVELIDLAPGRSPAPLYERESALQLLEGLAADCPGALCHGDPSRGNVLTAGDGHLMLIDPRGINGELSYDVAISAAKTVDGDPVLARVANLARLTGCDSERAEAWWRVAEVARV
jgi:streptomycin 6-kinase